MEFSKWLAVMITVLFAGVTIFACVVWAVSADKIAPKEIMDFISPPFTIVIGFYFAKSSVESYIKMKSKTLDKREMEHGNEEERA